MANDIPQFILYAAVLIALAWPFAVDDFFHGAGDTRISAFLGHLSRR